MWGCEGEGVGVKVWGGECGGEGLGWRFGGKEWGCRAGLKAVPVHCFQADGADLTRRRLSQFGHVTPMRPCDRGHVTLPPTVLHNTTQDAARGEAPRHAVIWPIHSTSCR